MQTDHLWDADAKTARHLILMTLDTWDTWDQAQHQAQDDQGSVLQIIAE